MNGASASRDGTAPDIPRTTLGCAGRHLVEDWRRTRGAFEAGVRWFGPDIQRNWAHIFLFLLIPLASVYMSQGLPTFYVGVLYFSLMAAYSRHLLGIAPFGQAVAGLAGALRAPLMIATAVFFLYSMGSAAWSPVPADAAREGLRVIAALALMVPIIALLPARDRHWQLYLPLLGLAGAAALLIIEFSPFPILRDDLYGQNIAFMNRAVLVVSFLLWPTLAVIGGRHATLQRACLLVLCVAAIFSSRSQASMLAFLSGALVTLLALFVPRIAAWLVGLGTVAAFAAAPFVAPHLGRILHLTGLGPYLDMSNVRRIEIWQAFSDVIWQRPIFGWGIKSTQEFGMRPIPGVDWAVGPAYHPHNTLIQTWVEVGLVGVLLCVLIVALLARACLRLPRGRAPYALGGLAAGVAVASVSHGMWQSWWICLILGSVAIFAMKDAVSSGKSS